MDFKVLFKNSPQNFNLSFNFTSMSGRTTPDASMKNQSLKTSERIKKKIFLAYKKKMCLAHDFLDQLYSRNMEEVIRLQKLKKMGMIYLLNIENLLGAKAVLIQKMVKGFLARRKYEGILIDLHRKYTCGLIEDLEQYAERTFYIGKVILKAVIKIQSVVRTWNYLRKNKNYLLQAKQQLRKIRIHCRVLASKHKLKQKSEEYIKSRLEKIRKNLIKLKIKQIIQRFKRSIKRNNKKMSKKTPKDSLLVSFSVLVGNILKGDTMKKESVSELSDSDSEDEVKEIELKVKKNSRIKRVSLSPCAAFPGIPVLIELKRKSQIWVERFDPQVKAKVIDLKQDLLNLSEAKRRISVTRPHSGLGIDGMRMKKQRASFSYSNSTYIK